MVVEIVANPADATPVDTSLLSAVTQPGAFSFTAQSNAALGTTVNSNPITVKSLYRFRSALTLANIKLITDRGPGCPALSHQVNG